MGDTMMRSTLLEGTAAWAAPPPQALDPALQAMRPDLSVTIQPSAATLFAQEAVIQDANNNNNSAMNNPNGSMAAFRASLARAQPPPAPPVSAVFEENVTTGGFRKVQVGEAFDNSSAWRDGNGGGGNGGALTMATADEADEALPPSYSLATGFDRYVNLIWRGCSLLLTGIVIAVVTIVEKQSQPGPLPNANGYSGNSLIASAILSVSAFVAPLRLVMYLLAMVGFLGAAEQYLQLRKASRLAVEAAIAQRAAGASGDGLVNLLPLPSSGSTSSSSAAGSSSSGSSLSSSLMDGQQTIILPVPRQTLSRGFYTKCAVFTQGVVAATVLASMVMDNRLRMVGSQPGATVASIASNSTAISDFNAWRVIIIIRLAFCLLNTVALLLTLAGPEEVDRIVFERVSSGEFASGGASMATAPLLMGGGGGKGNGGSGPGIGAGGAVIVPVGGGGGKS